MAVNLNLSEGFSDAANSYYSQGGSVNSGQSMSEGWSNSASESWSNSWTEAEAARQFSAEQAALAWARDKEAMYEQMAYNTMEAQKQRDWQAQMANTLYTRSTKNMREAGINPILAANIGLSGASVGSGATASLSGVPSAPLAQSFMDSYSNSGSRSYSSSFNWSNGYNNGSSWNEGGGSGWEHSEQGITTALEALDGMVTSALNTMSSGKALDWFTGGQTPYDSFMNNLGDYVADGIKNGTKNLIKNLKGNYEKEKAQKQKAKENGIKGGGGGHGF